jgi:hypothetical protein
VPLEKRLVLGNVLYADCPYPWLYRYYSIHEQKGITVWDEVSDSGRP